MAIAKAEGSGESSVQVKVEVSAQGTGRSTIHLPDGSTVDGKDRHLFVRIEKDHLARGDWLLNVLTDELHRVLDLSVDSAGNTTVKLSTPDGFVLVPWDDIPDALMLVVNR